MAATFTPANLRGKFEVIKNPHTGKLFFQMSTGERGAVSTKTPLASIMERPAISILKDDTTELYILHRKGDTNVVGEGSL